jgi:plastocyanin
MGNPERAESSEPPKAGRPLLRRGFYGAGAGICAAAAALSLIALTGGQGTSAATKDAAALGSLPKAAAPAKAPAAAPANNAAPAAAPGAKPAVAAPAAAPATGSQVMIMNYAFSPSSLTVTAGSTVTWTNMDTAPHTVTVSSGPVKFNSPTLQKGDTFTYTFTKAGTYQYYCAVHPDMKASVTVTGDTSTPTPTPTPTTSAPTTPAPTPTPTTSSPSPSEDCAVSSALQTFLTHLNAAHLSESPAQQVQDILNLDNYLKMHMVLVENMLAPLTNGGLTDIISGDLTKIFTHIETAHLEESPTQQLQDILNTDQYLKMHMAWIESLVAPIAAETC